MIIAMLQLLQFGVFFRNGLQSPCYKLYWTAKLFKCFSICLFCCNFVFWFYNNFCIILIWKLFFKVYFKNWKLKIKNEIFVEQFYFKKYFFQHILIQILWNNKMSPIHLWKIIIIGKNIFIPRIKIIKNICGNKI